MKRIVIVMMLLGIVSASAMAQSLKYTEYKGWKDVYILSNGNVEAVVVPSIGRVMQFRFVGEEGVFWENPAVAGKPVNPESKEWINFGGDKPWPAPQADWPKVTPRAWPPPIGFDASEWKNQSPVCHDKSCRYLVLHSAIDPHYGIYALRTIKLDPIKPVMTIVTQFFKVKGDPVKVGVWVITQVNEAEAVFMPIPNGSQYSDGYNKQSKELPEYFKAANGLIELKRDPKKSTKIGNDAGSLLWVGQKHMLKVDSPRVANADYPDNGSSAEVYTNVDPLKYIELEMLGPLKEMKVGDKIERTNIYTLMRRGQKTPGAEARKIFGNNKPRK